MSCKQLAAHAEHLGVGVDRDLQVPVLVALVDRIGEIFAAVLGPFDRPAEQLRCRHHGDVLGIDAELGAETAADVGGDDAKALVEVHQRGQRLLKIVRLLGRGVHRDAAVGLAQLGEQPARFDRMRRAAVLPQLLLEHMRGLGERRVDVAERHLVGGDDIGGELAADRRGILRGSHVGDERQGLVVHRDLRRGVLGDVAVVRHHHRHGFADVTDFAVGQRERPGLVERHAGIGVADHAALNHHLGEVVQGEHGMNAGDGERRGLVHGLDQRVRMRAPHERHVPDASQHDVVDEAPAPAQQRFIFQAGDA